MKNLMVLAVMAAVFAAQGKTMVAIGDSTVANHWGKPHETWMALFAKKHGMAYRPFGINGNALCLANDTAKWGKPVVERIDTLPEDADYILVSAGYNDANIMKSLQFEVCSLQFARGVKEIAEKLKARYPKAEIVFVNMWDLGGEQFAFVKKALRKAAKKYGFRFVDAQAISGIDPNDAETRKRLFQSESDTAHLNAEGHRIMLEKLERHLGDEHGNYDAGGWKLDWRDEFDGAGTVDETKWLYEVGFVRNHEPQYYTTNRVENCALKDGVLTITARKEKWANPLWVDRRLGGWYREREFADYTSAAIETRRAFLYGRLEVRAQTPGQWGAWPAIWTVGACARIEDKTDPEYYNWPASGEIDIVEIWGNAPTHVKACLHTSKHGREHVRPHDFHTVTGGGSGKFDKPGEEPCNGFHTYTMDWYEDEMVLFYDGRVYARMDLSKSDWPEGGNPFRKPHFLILNLALGGYGNQLKDTPDEKKSGQFPMAFKIDYVRHYAKQEAAEKVRKGSK